MRHIKIIYICKELCNIYNSVIIIHGYHLFFRDSNGSKVSQETYEELTLYYIEFM